MIYENIKFESKVTRYLNPKSTLKAVKSNKKTKQENKTVLV